MSDTVTLYTMVRDAARRLDHRVALAAKHDGEWRTISHQRMMERVRRISLGLHDLGVRKGDRVAVVSESRPEWTLLDIGTLGCGAALVPVYPTLTDDQVAHILGDSGSRVCVVSTQAQLDKVLPLLPTLRALERVVVIDRAEFDADAPVLTLDALEDRGAQMERESPGLADRLIEGAHADELATLIYTSGTTGKQKGVMLTHGNFISNIVATFDESDLFTASDVALSYLPLSHVLERTAQYGFLRTGVSLYYASGFDQVGRELKEVRPTVATSVPRLFEKMYAKICEVGRSSGGLKRTLFERALRCGDVYARAVDRGGRVSPLLRLERSAIADPLVFRKWREALGGRMKYFISGGAPLSPDIAYAFFGAGIPIYEGYGLTETSPVIAINRPERMSDRYRWKAFAQPRAADRGGRRDLRSRSFDHVGLLQSRRTDGGGVHG